MPISSLDEFTDAFNTAVAARGFTKPEVIAHLRQFGITKSYSTIQNYQKTDGGTKPSTLEEAQRILDALANDGPADPPRVGTQDALSELVRETAALAGDRAVLPNSTLLPLLNVTLAGRNCARVSLLVQTADLEELGLSLPLVQEQAP